MRRGRYRIRRRIKRRLRRISRRRRYGSGGTAL